VRSNRTGRIDKVVYDKVVYGPVAKLVKALDSYAMAKTGGLGPSTRPAMAKKSSNCGFKSRQAQWAYGLMDMTQPCEG
jgi:hypothetical protein